jgi:hypothetical protein
MRFGIALPGTGPLAEDAAVAATARAAEQLEYASVWSTSVRQLLVVTEHAQHLPVGLIITETVGPQTSPSWANALGSRLRYVGAGPGLHAAARAELPGALLLDTSDGPATGDPQWSHGIDGWSPLAPVPGGIPTEWWAAAPSLLLILRINGTAAGSVTAAHLRDAVDARADEVVVAFPGIPTLDQQLAAFADVAETVTNLGQRTS